MYLNQTNLTTSGIDVIVTLWDLLYIVKPIVMLMLHNRFESLSSEPLIKVNKLVLSGYTSETDKSESNTCFDCNIPCNEIVNDVSIELTIVGTDENMLVKSIAGLGCILMILPMIVATWRPILILPAPLAIVNRFVFRVIREAGLAFRLNDTSTMELLLIHETPVLKLDEIGVNDAIVAPDEVILVITLLESLVTKHCTPLPLYVRLFERLHVR